MYKLTCSFLNGNKISQIYIPLVNGGRPMYCSISKTRGNNKGISWTVVIFAGTRWTSYVLSVVSISLSTFQMTLTWTCDCIITNFYIEFEVVIISLLVTLVKTTAICIPVSFVVEYVELDMDLVCCSCCKCVGHR